MFNIDLLFENLTNPALLFFILGILAVCVKSDLEIPPTSAKFISLYLLFSIGFRGGQELAHEKFDTEMIYIIFFGIFISLIVPLIYFFILRLKFNLYDSGAIAATYGSVSAVTFITAVTYLESFNYQVNGHMVAIMALMESPAIIISLLLVSFFNTKSTNNFSKLEVIKHSFTNSSIFLLLGSLVIGFIASEKQALGISPFTNDLFKGFLVIFLLEMGITSGKKLKSLFSYGIYPLLFAILIPLINGILVGWLSGFITDNISDRFLFSILAAGASYIAVPAAMKNALPEANPSLFLPMALAITFPFNITIGFPIYYFIVTNS
jgi:uncharacterized protein